MLWAELHKYFHQKHPKLPKTFHENVQNVLLIVHTHEYDSSNLFKLLADAEVGEDFAKDVVG